MKYYFIFNPAAGSEANRQLFLEKFNELKNDYSDLSLYETKSVGDATTYVRNLINNLDEEVTLFACGGDGTCNEVINGIAGSKKVNFGIIPTGSCNDFLKTFPGYDFFDLKKQIEGKTVDVDLLKAEDFYCLNVANMGFDAKVNYDQIQFRSKYPNVKKAYNHAIIHNLLHKKGDKVKIMVDDKEIYNGKSLLIVLGNGEHYGGSYQPFANTSYNDGIIDGMVVNNVSILRFASLLKKYKYGLVYNNPKFKKIVTSFKGKKIKIESEDLLTVCLDGETIFRKSVEIVNIPSAIKFILPKKD